MNGKTILASGPATQTVEAVAQLIRYHNHGQPAAEMPEFYRLSAEMVLVRSNKGDAYYVTTPRACSCPSATYRPGKTCKHQRKYFPQPKAARTALPVDSIRPDMRGFRPVSLLPGEMAEVA
ncbi:MAG: hypothetical protein A4E44_00083 [Methanosaeta sp. PtaB.Bin018]|nr:MAG: hypothetical protein A4E44_00083 [Methanosaeta sp. PtaB.Bin018]